MKFYKNLYVGDTIRKPDKIIRKLKKYAKLPTVYIIVYVQETGQLEICNSLFLQQWYYREHPPYIVGIAGSQEEAVGLIQRMAQEAVNCTGRADLSAYLFGAQDPRRETDLKNQ